MKTSLHIGKFIVNEKTLSEKERELLERALRWYVRSPLYDRDSYEWVAVCPEFDLVKTSAVVPFYDVVFSVRADGDLSLKFTKRDDNEKS